VFETDCTITHEGQKFESGGAYLLPCTDGKVRGVVYVNRKAGTVITWHGETIARLDAYTEYRGNFCKMARISFTHEGRKFVGDFCPDWADACKVRSTK
jgi:hypothetical protein